MYQHILNLQWVGKLSLEDADVLAQHGKDKIVLEQGAGGSTMLFKQTASKVYCVEPVPAWAEKTSERLNQIQGCDVEFINDIVNVESVDMIFVDGPFDQRASFATAAWYKLKIGGKLLFHDTRRQEYQTQFLNFVNDVFNRIATIDININASNGVPSNISVVEKQAAVNYVNWVQV